MIFWVVPVPPCLKKAKRPLPPLALLAKDPCLHVARNHEGIIMQCESFDHRAKQLDSLGLFRVTRIICARAGHACACHVL